jgi:hypothetical protein
MNYDRCFVSGEIAEFRNQKSSQCFRPFETTETTGTIGTVCAMLRLTFGSMSGYTAPMPIQFILPKKFTRAQIEWRVDELALQFQGTKDKKILAQIAALNRVLAKMDAPGSDSSQPKNRH